MTKNGDAACRHSVCCVEVSCCPDKAQCYGMGNSTLDDAKDYYLQYTVGYEPVGSGDETAELAWLKGSGGHQALTVFSLDVTSTHTNDCQIQYVTLPCRC